MPITIGSNIASLNAQRQLGRASDALSTIYEKLSSGQRINHASDDAAGLAIATNLKSSSRVYTQAIRNVNDGVSALSISDGALGALSQITQRQLELSEQAANGSYSAQQRSVMNKEVNALSKEYNRIIQTTSFNGIQLFQGSILSQGLSIQAGFGTADSLTLAIGSQGSRSIGTGTFSGGTSFVGGTNAGDETVTGDFNNDGNLDIIYTSVGDTALYYSVGNGDGTFKAATVLSNTNSGINTLRLGDVNGDGKTDIITNAGGALNVFVNNGDGTFKAPSSISDPTNITYSIDVADINGDGYADVVSVGTSSGRVFFGKSDGTLSAGTSFSFGFSNGSNGVTLVKNGYGGDYSAVVNGGSGGSTVIRLSSAGNPTGISQDLNSTGYVSTSTGDFNGDGIGDFYALNSVTGKLQTYLGNGDGTFLFGQTITDLDNTTTSPIPNARTRVVDLNNDGIADLVRSSSHGIQTYLGNGDGTFNAGNTAFTLTNSEAMSFGDFNKDGRTDIAITGFGTKNVSIGLADGTTTLLTKQFDITTQANARDALTFLNDQLSRISLERGAEGAFQSRLQVTNSNLQSLRENYDAASSRITDADIAQTSSELIRNNIVQQAAASVLAQANQLPALALQLLRG